MLYYPSLSSGAATQYPIVRRTAHDVLLTTTPGGYEQHGLTGRPAQVEWSLEYAEISDAELKAFESFFTTTRGGLESFVFCDPLANLLRWSEDPTNDVWSKSGLTVTAQVSTTTGLSESTLINAEAAECRVAQTLTLPPTALCVFSCELKGQNGMAATLNAAGTTRGVELSGLWHRYWVASETGAGGNLTVAVGVPSGGTLQMRCPQAELQLAPSSYKLSYGRGGVYSETRFSGTGLRATHTGPNRNSLAVSLTSRLVSE